MSKWEYDVMRFDLLSESLDKEVVPVLDDRGAVGWELVNVTEDPAAEGGILAFFKRLVEEEQLLPARPRRPGDAS